MTQFQPQSTGLQATPDDVLRSVRRWFGLLLPEPWDVQFTRDEETERPSVFVVPANRVSSAGSAYVRDYAWAFDVFLYPTGFEGEPARSRVEALNLAWQVERAFSQGLRDENDQLVSRTARMPVWNHAGIDWDQDILTGTLPFDYLPVSQVTTDAVVDPDDDTLFTVHASFSIAWRGDGDIEHLVGVTLQNVQTQHNLG